MKTLYCIFFFILTVNTFAQESRHKPDIIFILIDDQRYDFLSFLDHPWIKTPNIDKLAAESMYFENAFVTTSLCSPSRASILTGQYAHMHKVMDNDTPLPQDIPTFPRELQKIGYTTAFMGKWHMGGNNDMPREGFDRWISFRGQGPYFDPVFNIDGERKPKEGYTTDLLTDYAVEYIKEDRKSDRPYFLYLSHKAIHESFIPADRHKGVYKDLKIPKPDSYDTSEGKPLWVKRMKNSWHGADRDYSIQDYGSFDRFFQLYSEAMLAVDESVGRIRDALLETGRLDETVIIYYSDNGYLMGEHGLIDKRVMYEESIRVPCFVHWPKVIKKSITKSEMILNIDIGPTILELAGTLIPSTMQGLSFARIINDESVNWRNEFIYEYFIDPMAVQTPTILGLRTEKYSYMTYHGIWDIYELYDIENDPDQMNNLLGHITYGNDYGSFLGHVQKQDKDIWPVVKALDDKLNDLLLEKNGLRQPDWERQ